MAINKNDIINVLNYNENPVAIKTNIAEYLCSQFEDEAPSITPLSYSEVEYLNSNYNAFKIGTLRFPEEIEEEIYTSLRIIDWKEIMKNEDIEEILLHPSLDGLSKIIAIKNVSLFERIRGVFFSLKNTNQYDISTRVEKIINTRYKELCNKQTKTKILLTQKDTNTTIPNEEVNSLKLQNEEMKSQMESMQKMMEQMMAMQTANVAETKVEKKVEVVKTEAPKKQAGRPSTKRK